MNHAARKVPTQETCAVEVVVHISKDLGDEERNFVVSALEETDGILGAEFCPSRSHLVLAKYDRNTCTSQDVLKHFNQLGLEARLIGPI
jgi:hypothetical protein